MLGYGLEAGVYGETEESSSTPGYGVQGYDPSNSKGGDENAGVLGQTRYGTGVLALANGGPSTVDYGATPIGLYAVGNAGVGVFTESNDFPFAAANTKNNSGIDLVESGYIIFAYANSPQIYFTVDDSGNAKFSGTVTASKPLIVSAKGASGIKRIEYGSRATTPKIEDEGETQMTNGRAIVAIDAALADTIDMRTPYHVFLTPLGDCNGLYVTQRTPAGFVVRELRGGRSTLAFDYRIVGKPIGDDGARLAVAPADDVRPPTIARSAHPASFPMSPEARLESRIGSQAYAKAVRNLRARQAQR